MKSLILWQNFAQLGGASISASSYSPAQPARRLRDQMRSNKWRSATGWTVVAGFNDSLDFNNGTDRTATLAAGSYLTGDLFAAAVQAALAAAYATGTWTVSYSASTHLFTIAHSATAFVLKWATGSHASSSPARDLGFAVGDSSSATSHSSDGVSYQSRHYVAVDFGVAMDVLACIALEHNSGSGGSLTLQGADSAAAALGSPVESLTLLDSSSAGPARIAAFDSARNRRYWAVVIDDVANLDGFAEWGLLYLGSWLETPELARGAERTPVDFSSVSYSDQGANWQDRRQAGDQWSLAYEVVTRSEADEIAAMAKFLLVGGDFFFVEDETDLTGLLRYVHFVELPAAKQRGSGMDLWDVSLKFQDSLG
jgi:hypothetical protein